jgi:hypothetical protein
MCSNKNGLLRALIITMGNRYEKIKALHMGNSHTFVAQNEKMS